MRVQKSNPPSFEMFHITKQAKPIKMYPKPCMTDGSYVDAKSRGEKRSEHSLHKFSFRIEECAHPRGGSGVPKPKINNL